MTIELSDAVREDRMDAIEAFMATGTETAALLEIRTGAAPTDTSSADSGTVVASITLPTDPFTSASGVLTKAGTWQDTNAPNAGTAGHFRIYNAATERAVVMQGSVADTGSPDMTIDNAVIAAGQTVTVTTFQLTDGNADDA